MKICGAVLAIFYVGLMVFAVYKEKLKSISSAFILIGCLLVFLYTFLNMVWCTLSTSDEFLKSPYEQYPVTICGQTIILTNGELAAALLSLPEKKREIIYLYFFGNYTQQEIANLYGHCKSTASKNM